MGTSLPELTVSLSAALRGADDIGLGNVIGSNIFNIGVVLGLSALIRPMRVHGSAVRLEWPFMFLASFQLLLLARDGQLDRLEGVFFIVGLALFTAYVVRISRTEVRGEEAADLAETVDRKSSPRGWRIDRRRASSSSPSGRSCSSSAATCCCSGAVALSRAIGMTERVIGLTVVAAGTGAPELATSLMAARRGQSEIALANVIGSNIFNVLGILGVTALVTPITVAPAMIAQRPLVDARHQLRALPDDAEPLHRDAARRARCSSAVYATYLTLLVRAG